MASSIIKQKGTAILLSYGFFALGVFPLAWLLIWSLFNESIKGFISAATFLIFILITISPIFFSKIFKPKESLGEASLGFVGFAILGLLISSLGRAGFSVFNLVVVPSQYILSSVAAQLPYFWSGFLTTISAPVAEEFLFLIAIPSIILESLKVLSGKYRFLKNTYVKIAVSALPTAYLFAVFHVGNIGLTTFFTAAVIFRTVQIVLYETETNKTLFGAIGFHLGINIGSSGGLLAFLSIFLSEGAGIAVLLFFAMIVYAAVVYALKKK